MKCPHGCKGIVIAMGGSQTMLGIIPFFEDGVRHCHDSNTTTTRYKCKECGSIWDVSVKGRDCPAPDCDFKAGEPVLKIHDNHHLPPKVPRDFLEDVLAFAHIFANANNVSGWDHQKRMNEKYPERWMDWVRQEIGKITRIWEENDG